MDDKETWRRVAESHQWMVPWRYLEQDGRWLIGGYSNVALNVLDRHLEDRADQTAIVDRIHNTRCTYRQLFWQSARMARWLRDAGMGAGDRLALYGPISISMYAAALAALRLGGVLVTIPETLSDPQFRERLSGAEVRWLVADLDDGRLSRIGSDGVHVLTGEALLRAEREAEGLLDPVAVEANGLGFLLYGDEKAPYAYAGIGALLGWTHSWASQVPVAPGDRVGLCLFQRGGLAHPIVVTLVLMNLGASVSWLDDDVMSGVREQGMQTLVVASGHTDVVGEASDRLQQVVILGPDRPACSVRPGRAIWHHLRPHMAKGVYGAAGDGEASGPSSDRTVGGREDTPLIMPAAVDHPWVAEVQAVPGVREVLSTKDSGGRTVLWIAGSAIPSEVAGRLVPGNDNPEAPRPLGPDSPVLVMVGNLPETIEGQLAVSLLDAIGRGEAHLEISQLANPGSVESLVRAFHQAAS